LILRSFAHAVVPTPLRRWLQRRNVERKVSRYAKHVVSHRYGKVTLQIELADPLAAGWYDRDWPELPELTLLGQHRLQEGARVFNLGAHQGVVGLMLGHRVGANGQVVVVEPNPHNHAMCARNIALNRMPWVVPHQAAVADYDGELSFNAGLNGQAGELSDYAGLMRVPSVTLDTLTAKYGPPDVVFLDVEGFECRALASASRTILAKPDWFVEVHLGFGLEAAGGSVEKLLAHFPESAFTRFVHADDDVECIPLESAPAGKLKKRFFLTAIAKNGNERRCSNAQ
jgi:FkbM family methyltransferase